MHLCVCVRRVCVHVFVLFRSADLPPHVCYRYDQWTAYGNSKVSNLLFAREFHSRFSGTGVTACSVMPGGIHTGLQGEVSRWIMFKWQIVSPFFFKTIEQGAATTLTACKVDLALPGNGGAYWENCAPTKLADKLPAAYGEVLWKWTEALVSGKEGGQEKRE